ncbi:MAG: exo-beta-N-acetylmuramidase NamZ domain-containing protein, partial [Candidatus Baltobacteraceae bacterium]
MSDTWRDLHGRCVGVITNQTGVTSRLEPIVDAIKRNHKICIKAIYSPEHGLRGDRPAGSYVSSYTDERTGLPVYSLYGSTRHPNAQMLAGVDVLLFDIQDVGDRAYTYVSTMAYAMEAAKQYGKEIWVLDRPNPIGGMVEGPVLAEKYKSFIGLYPIAMRHGMTVGELARLFNDHFGIGSRLHVIAMRGYNHDMLWPDTGLQWVQTSPNIPEWDTAIVYPGTGLIDNAGINNGTGYTKPFKYAGAAGLDGQRLADALNARNIPGVYFRAAYWTPMSGFWKDKQLSGVELVVFNPRVFPAVRSAVEILSAVRQINPK